MEPEKTPDKPEDYLVEVKIVCDTRNGNISIQSKELNDKIFMYGVLESAKLAVVQM